MTVQRQLIWDIVKETYGHLTAEEIFCKAKEKMPTIVLATVYNSLNYLSDQGYIRRIKIAGEADHFDKTLSPHNHIICDRCKKVEDIAIRDISKEIEENYQIDVLSCEINVHYVCSDCQKEEKRDD